jgi:hypothetical protein
MIALDEESTRWTLHMLETEAQQMRDRASTWRRKGVAHIPLRRAASHAADVLERSAREIEKAIQEIKST